MEKPDRNFWPIQYVARFEKTERGFPGGQWLRICLAMQGTLVQSLVQEDATGQLSPCTTTEPVFKSPGAETTEPTRSRVRAT